MKYLNYLETHIINKCNLNCVGCSHFSNIIDNEDAGVDIEIFRNDFKRLGELFDHIFMIRLMGGEPLLNERVAEYLEIVREYFPMTNLKLLTNGLLIPDMPDGVLKRIAETNTIFDISSYPPTLKIKEKIEKKAFKFGIVCEFSEPIIRFHKRFNLYGTSEPCKTFAECSSNICTFLRNGKIAACPAAFTVDSVNKRFNTDIDVTSDRLDIYQAGITAEDILKHILTPMKSCCYCSQPEDFEWKCGKKPILEDWLVKDALEKYKKCQKSTIK